ncbi:MAG: UvrD-helicase domain-containing protein [bacterium]|nr:UvrD-helicase domain-containing protein [bacterium]
MIDHKTERNNEVNTIKNSVHPRKVIVAGPGTGKSYLFSELIKKKRAEGKANFLAITFIGKLGDTLADDLCGLAETMTMHGFARSFVLSQCRGWNYYPRIYELIEKDLKTEGVTKFEIGDENYERKTKHYQAVGDADVVHYAAKICKEDPNKIPVYDLILVDEYQDFNAVESELVDLLAQKNEIVIVGDDDQALYGFKGSSPSFIREKYDPSNKHFESHTLRFCSRCTEVIIKYSHGLVSKFNLNDPAKKRIQKDYICYVPDKSDDSTANPKIHLIKDCPVGMIAYKIRSELEEIVENQKIKEVLVIGEGRSCEALLKTVASQLKNYGFKNVGYRGDGEILNIRNEVTNAYKLIAKDESSTLGWRILGNPTEESVKKKHISNSKTLSAAMNGTPKKLQEIKDQAISDLETDIESGTVSDKEVRKSLLFQQLKRSNLYLARPLCNLDITVCNILNSKGLGADVVFLVGFDQGRFPTKKAVTDSEVYQMLVAITRAKKRIYLINTIGKKVSEFADSIGAGDLEVEEIKTKQ